MSVFIDPYMFELVEEQEIRDNISFFMKIIKLSSTVKKEARLKLALYKGVIERIQARAIQPFPIQIANISDDELKSTILQINNMFNNILIECIESIDVDACDGDQNFLVNDEKVTDSIYFELFSSMLTQCYSGKLHFDKRIITGIKSIGKSIGSKCVLTCECTKHNYNNEIQFVDINDFFSERELIIERLNKAIKLGEVVVVDNVQANMGEHHNYVQADGKKFQKLDDLSSKNKIVLKLLKKLGLFKIVFGRFSSQGVQCIGTMCIHKLKETNIQDILIVKFSAETKMIIETSLYFPKGIGRLLNEYFQNEQMTYKSVNELLEKII